MKTGHINIRVAAARNVAERWRQTYQRNDGWTRTAYGDSEVVYNKLCDLGPSPPIMKVVEIIGNKSWTHLTCAGCNEYTDVAAQVGEDLLICEDCAHDAHTALAGPSE